VTALRVPETDPPREAAPAFADVFHRLQITVPSRWNRYPPACPMDPEHPFRIWTHPGKCPRCQDFLEPAGMPFRMWS
jgi:hypothetical protein